MSKYVICLGQAHYLKSKDRQVMLLDSYEDAEKLLKRLGLHSSNNAEIKEVIESEN